MVERRAVKAGLLYCAVVFATGFILGVIRTMWVAPLSGELVAVALEAPVMLAISWSACAWVAERLEVSENFVDRLLMGGVALAVLVAAEAVIGLVANGKTLAAYFLTYGQSGILLGLLAQLGFAIFPIIRRRRDGV
jgi:hypothetical protein